MSFPRSLELLVSSAAVVLTSLQVVAAPTPPRAPTSPPPEPTAPPSWIRGDGSSPPRLSVEQALWAMGKLPRDGEEWSREEKIAQIAGAGFDGFMVFLPQTAEEQGAYADLAARHGLAVTLQCESSTVADLEVALQAARRMKARGLVAMIQPTFVSYEDGAEKIREMMAASQRAGVPFYVETHRGTITQDILLTGRWARKIDGVQFHADLSHFVISYGIGRPPRGPIRQAFDAVLSRTGMIDGRVGNGNQVQIDIGPKGDSRHAKLFAGWWKQAMVHWLKNAADGDVFVFKSELGPPSYSIVGPDGREISDRWAQALVMRDLGIRTWNEAVNEAGRGQPYVLGRAVAGASPGGAAKVPDLTPQESPIGVLRGISHKIGDFYLAGQPAQPDLDRAKEIGVKTVINLRLERELFGLGFEEDYALELLKVKYIHLPIGPDDIDDAKVEKFYNALEREARPILIHGSNANRVWGMWAGYLALKYGVPIDDTKAQAAKLGVKNLVVEDFLRDYIQRRDSAQKR